MASKTPSVLKSYFQTGDKPTSTQWSNLIDTIFAQTLLQPSVQEALDAALEERVSIYGDVMTGRLWLPSYAFTEEGAIPWNDGSIVVDFDGPQMQNVTMEGALATISTSHRGLGKTISVRIVGSELLGELALAAGINPLKSRPPWFIPENSSAIMTVASYGPAESATYAVFAEVPEE